MRALRRRWVGAIAAGPPARRARPRPCGPRGRRTPSVGRRPVPSIAAVSANPLRSSAYSAASAPCSARSTSRRARSSGSKPPSASSASSSSISVWSPHRSRLHQCGAELPHRQQRPRLHRAERQAEPLRDAGLRHAARSTSARSPGAARRATTPAPRGPTPPPPGRAIVGDHVVGRVQRPPPAPPQPLRCAGAAIAPGGRDPPPARAPSSAATGAPSPAPRRTARAPATAAGTLPARPPRPAGRSSSPAARPTWRRPRSGGTARGTRRPPGHPRGHDRAAPDRGRPPCRGRSRRRPPGRGGLVGARRRGDPGRM